MRVFSQVLDKEVEIKYDNYYETKMIYVSNEREMMHVRKTGKDI